MPQIFFPLPNPSNPHVSVFPAKVKISYPTTTSPLSMVATRANLLISSQGYTSNTGELTFHLKDLHAGGGHWGGEAVITNPDLVFIATALSKSPVVITWTKECKETSGGSYYDLLNGTQIAGISHHYDIVITVRSWTLASKPAPNVTFGWLCIAEGTGWEAWV